MPDLWVNEVAVPQLKPRVPCVEHGGSEAFELIVGPYYGFLSFQSSRLPFGVLRSLMISS
jgi:hypothetical protein